MLALACCVIIMAGCALLAAYALRSRRTIDHPPPDSKQIMDLVRVLRRLHATPEGRR